MWRVRRVGRSLRRTVAGGGILREVTAPVVSADTAAFRKARGAFFTPEPLARYVTEWAVRDVADKVLEPSCGEAAFLLSAVNRFVDLAAEGVEGQTPHLDGVELHEGSAAAARRILAEAGVAADVGASA